MKSSDQIFWEQTLEILRGLDDNKLDVFHKTNRLWIIAVKKSVYFKSNHHFEDGHHWGS